MRKRLAIILLFMLLLIGGGVTYLYLDNRAYQAYRAYLADKVVYGRVLDASNGLPVPGVEVVVAGVATRTDGGGAYRLESVPAEASASVRAPGYQPETVHFTIPELTKSLAVDISLHPNLLVGVVRDAWDQQPVARALIRADGREAGSDAVGLYALSRVVPPLTVEAEAPGYLPWQGRVEELAHLSGETTFDVALVPNTVTGTVRAADDRPLSGTEVILGPQVVTTSQDGSFALHRVTAGAVIQVHGPADYHQAQVTYEGQVPLAAVLQPRVATVMVQDGFAHRPVMSATLFLEDKPPQLSDERGQAVISRVRPGEKIHVEAKGYLPAEGSYRSDGQVVTVTLQPYELQGVVRDARTLRPLPGAKIYAGGEVLPADNEGAYHLAKIPNAPVVMVKIGGYRKALLNVQTGEVTPTTSGFVAPCANQPQHPGPLCLDIALAPADIRGLYIPYGLLSKPDRIKQLLELIDKSELNAFVVDVKSDKGYLPYASKVPLAIQLGVGGERKGWLPLKDLLAIAKQKNIYTIARIVVFKDDPLARGRPDLAIKRADGSIWVDREGLAWVNPLFEETWDYNIALAKEVAETGFDEVQFDYIRFPSDGDVGTIVYTTTVSTETRTEAIRTFTQRMTAALQPHGVFTSVDLFGLTVWVQPGTDMNIGQRVEDIAPYVDYICPMVYPSTFGSGNLGYQRPVDYPYEVVFRSQQAAMQRVPPWTNVRPWIQAYWYELSEMQLQKQAAMDGGAIGWTYWNASGNYDPALFDKR